MALLNTKLTREQLRGIVRRELLDTGTRWWTNNELNDYIDDWQMELQEEFEFVWGTATITTSTATIATTAVATDIHRLDAIYWNNKRLAERSVQELDILDRQWREAAVGTPKVAYQPNPSSVGFWEPAATAGTAVFEYPKVLTFATDTSTMQIPAWVKYSAANYCAYRAYLRAGPNQDINRAMKRKAKFAKQLQRYRTTYTNYFPEKYPQLRASGRYEGDILIPDRPLKP